MALCPSGASKKWSGMLAGHWLPNRPDATSGGVNVPVRPTPKTSPRPRWGMARSAVKPGAAPAAAGLPPANFPRCPSGTKRQASATSFRWSDGCQRDGHPAPPPIPSCPFSCPKFPCPTRPHSRTDASRRACWAAAVRLRGISLGSFRLCVLSDLCGGWRKRPEGGGAEWNTAEIGMNAEREGRLRESAPIPKTPTAQNLITPKNQPLKNRRRHPVLPANCQGPL